MNNNDNKSIKLYKNNFLTNILKFFKKLFNRSPKNSNFEQETNTNDYHKKDSIFFESIKIKQVNVEPTELQIKFENNKINFDAMSNEEIHSLNELYKNQIENLKKQIDNKKTELKMLKFKTTNNLTN